MSAVVEKVDVLNRLVSIKTDDGRVATVKVGPEVQNLVMVNPGDRVVVRYREAIGAAISSTPASGQQVTVDIDAERARLGQRPAASASSTTNIPVTINSVDTRTNTVTLPRQRWPGAVAHRADAAGAGVHQAAQGRRQRGRELHRGRRTERRAGEEVVAKGDDPAFRVVACTQMPKALRVASSAPSSPRPTMPPRRPPAGISS